MGNEKLQKARQKADEIIRGSDIETDLPHAKNIQHWLLVLNPTADDVLQFAAYAHDVERGMPDRLRKEMFDTYDEYKSAHAKRAGRIAAAIAEESGFSTEDSKRLSRIIEDAEFSSDDPEVQLVCDADSISFFDTNADYYLKTRGLEGFQKKVRFMYDRASDRAKEHIRGLAKTRPTLSEALELK